jgi:ComF family protein
MSSFWVQHVKRFHQAVAEELFPAPQQEMLDAAQNHLWQVDGPGEYCPRCGASAGPFAALPGGCPFCIDKPLPWRRITRLSAYRPPMDAWVRAMKFGNRWAWANCCGRLLAQSMRDPPPSSRVAVCGVPMHWFRRWRRGYNQAQLLATSLAKARRWPVADILHRPRHTRPQTRVAPSQRRTNVHHSFDIANVDLKGWHLVLVDDVKTTGATLAACARLLKRAGAESIEAAVIAVADPRGHDWTKI